MQKKIILSIFILQHLNTVVSMVFIRRLDCNCRHVIRYVLCRAESCRLLWICFSPFHMALNGDNNIDMVAFCVTILHFAGKKSAHMWVCVCEINVCDINSKSFTISYRSYKTQIYANQIFPLAVYHSRYLMILIFCFISVSRTYSFIFLPPFILMCQPQNYGAQNFLSHSHWMYASI